MYIYPIETKELAIEPEIIPKSSNEGEEAKSIYPIWMYISISIVTFTIFVILLKTIFTALLITIGLYFIWDKLTKLLASN